MPPRRLLRHWKTTKHPGRTHAYDPLHPPDAIAMPCVMSKPATPTLRDRRDADASITYAFGPLSISEPDRVRPGKEFIERMRTTFPIEREMDKMLTRKMEHRAAPAYAGASLERMTEHL